MYIMLHISKEMECAWLTFFPKPQRLKGFYWGVVNSRQEDSYYVRLIGIKGAKLVK